MPSLRSLYALLVALAFVLGTMVPVPHGAGHDMHGMSASVMMDPASAHCDRCDGAAAVPMACAKAFCAGSAMILADAAAGTLAATATLVVLRPDVGGSSLTRFPDPPPPRTALIG